MYHIQVKKVLSTFENKDSLYQNSIKLLLFIYFSLFALVLVGYWTYPSAPEKILLPLLS